MEENSTSTKEEVSKIQNKELYISLAIGLGIVVAIVVGLQGGSFIANSLGKKPQVPTPTPDFGSISSDKSALQEDLTTVQNNPNSQNVIPSGTLLKSPTPTVKPTATPTSAPTATPTSAPTPTPTEAPHSPTVSSQTQSSITSTGATLGGNVTSDGGASITARGVCVGTSSNPSVGGTCFTSSGTTGAFTANATNLNSGTLYHFRAYATNSVGTSYTSDDTFTTLAVAPAITSPTHASITSSGATLGGNITSDGGASITERGVCVGTSSNPATGGNCFTSSGTTGSFTVNATGLSSGTPYHYRAYATNSVGTSYTSDDTFTTQ